MQTVKRQAFMRKALVMATILVVGVILLLPAGRAAYAAEETNAQSATGVKTTLTGQYSYYSTITSAPTVTPDNSLARYEVYPTYLFFKTGGDSNLINYNLYMDIRPVGGTWSTYYFTNYYTTYEIKGLKPNTKYEAVLYYKSSSGLEGPRSGAVRFKTAPNKKASIKSVKVQLINVKKHYQKVYGYYTGVYLGKRAYYTYKIRTTVTLKKKPKTKYFNINGKWYKGNKKKYTYTTGKKIWWYTSPRGQKYTVSAYTAQSKVWGGYSLLYQKTKKAR